MSEIFVSSLLLKNNTKGVRKLNTYIVEQKRIGNSFASYMYMCVFMICIVKKWSTWVYSSAVSFINILIQFVKIIKASCACTYFFPLEDFLETLMSLILYAIGQSSTMASWQNWKLSQVALDKNPTTKLGLDDFWNWKYLCHSTLFCCCVDYMYSQQQFLKGWPPG